MTEKRSRLEDHQRGMTPAEFLHPRGVTKTTPEREGETTLLFVPGLRAS